MLKYLENKDAPVISFLVHNYVDVKSQTDFISFSYLFMYGTGQTQPNRK